MPTHRRQAPKDHLNDTEIQSVLGSGKIDQYEIIGYCGSGMTAHVFKVSAEGKTYALKLFTRPHTETYGVDRILRRLQLEISIGHHQIPGMVRVYAAGRCSDALLPYSVMEFVEGEPLDSRMGQRTASQVGLIFSQLGLTLSTLESHGYSHRDVKPSNFIFNEESRTTTLLDLGVLRRIGTSDGTGADFIGTRKYAPPEFISGTNEDTKEGWRAITFWQLGASMYEVLTGSNFTAVGPRNVSERREWPIKPNDAHYNALQTLSERALAYSVGSRLELTWDHFIAAKGLAQLKGLQQPPTTNRHLAGRDITFPARLQNAIDTCLRELIHRQNYGPASFGQINDQHRLGGFAEWRAGKIEVYVTKQCTHGPAPWTLSISGSVLFTAEQIKATGIQSTEQISELTPDEAKASISRLLQRHFS